MSRAEFTQLPYAKQLEMPAMQLPERYAIPFDWGHFHVTEQAHEAYGLTPLTGDILTDGLRELDMTATTSSFSVNIWLTGPGEVEFKPHEPSGLSSIKANTNTYLHNAGVGMEVAFDKSRSVFKQGIAADIESKAEGVEAEAIIARTNPAGALLPLMEMLEKQVPDMMIHGMAQYVGDNLASGLYQLENADSRHRTLRAMGGVMAVGLSVGITELGLSIADPALAGSETVAVGMAAGGSIGGAVSVYRILKGYLQTIETRQGFYHQNAYDLAQLVANDIHQMYCASHFDARTEAALPDATDLADADE